MGTPAPLSRLSSSGQNTPGIIFGRLHLSGGPSSAATSLTLRPLCGRIRVARISGAWIFLGKKYEFLQLRRHRSIRFQPSLWELLHFPFTESFTYVFSSVGTTTQQTPSRHGPTPYVPQKCRNYHNSRAQQRPGAFPFYHSTQAFEMKILYIYIHII